MILRVVNPGEVLRLMAVMGGLPHEVTAETLRSSQVAFDRKDDFLRFGDFTDRRLISMRGASVTIYDCQILEEVAGVRPRVAARFAATTSMV